MTQNDFVSLRDLPKAFINRKVNTKKSGMASDSDGSVTKDEPLLFTLFTQYTGRMEGR